jgi:hypothetical protein
LHASLALVNCAVRPASRMALPQRSVAAPWSGAKS